MDPSTIQALKMAMVNASGLSKDALHIHVGLFVFFVAALAWRHRKGNLLLPLLATMAVATLGEVVDILTELERLGHWRWRGSVHDWLNTLAWPAGLTLLWRLRVLPPPGAGGPGRRRGPTLSRWRVRGALRRRRACGRWPAPRRP
jgi:hypothetical protein